MKILICLLVMFPMCVDGAWFQAKPKNTKATHFGYEDGFYTYRSTPIKNKKGKVIGYRKKKVWVSQDNGRGSPLLNPSSHKKGISTNNTTREAVALPPSVICSTFKLPPIPRPFDRSYWLLWSKVRNSAVEVCCLATGRKAVSPFVDIGPGNGQLKKGIGIDLTHALMKRLAGTQGLSKGVVPVSYRILPGYYDKSRLHPFCR